MSSLLFESRVKLNGSFSKRYLVLDEKKFEIKKKRSIFSSEYEVLDTYLIKDIKMTNSRILVRVKDYKYVEVILNNKSLLIKFKNEDLAKEFCNKLIELREKENLFNKGIELVKGFNIKGAIKTGCFIAGLVSNVVKNEKVKKGLKTASLVGASIVDALDFEE